MTDLVKTENSSLAVTSQETWGVQNVDLSDILIPRVMMAQGMSKAVAAEKCQTGDLLRSTDDKVLAAKGQAVEFIPLSTFKTWVISEQKGQKFEYRREEPYTPANQDAPLEWQEDGKTFRRDRQLSFYILLTDDVKREKAALAKAAGGEFPDPDDALLPLVLSFKRTSYTAGKELVTHFSKAAYFNVPPASGMFNLSCEKVSNDKGTFYTFAVARSGKTDPVDLAIARRWFDYINGNKVKVDEEGELEEVAQHAAPVEPGNY